MNRLASAVAIAGVLVLGAPRVAGAQNAPARPTADVAGRWIWTAAVNGEVVSEGTMRFSLSNGALSGVIVTPDGEMPIQRVAFDGRTVTIVFQTPDDVITAEGRFVDDNLMRGTWSDSRQTPGTWSATRRTGP